MPYTIKAIPSNVGYQKTFYQVFNKETNEPVNKPYKRYIDAQHYLQALEHNVSDATGSGFHTVDRIVKEHFMTGGAIQHGTLYWVDPRATIPALADALNSTTDPSEVLAVLDKLKVKTDDGKSTAYEYLKNNEANAMQTATNIEQLIESQYEESMKILNMFRSGNPTGLKKATEIIGDGISIFNTLKSIKSPDGILKAGIGFLKKAVSFMMSPEAYQPSANVSYSYKQQLKSELGNFAGAFGELGATIAGELGQWFGAKSMAELNDSAVEDRIKKKRELAIQYIDDFRKWWANQLAFTEQQEQQIAKNVQEGNAKNDEITRYNNEVFWVNRLTDDEFEKQFGDRNRGDGHYISFDEWKASKNAPTGNVVHDEMKLEMGKPESQVEDEHVEEPITQVTGGKLKKSQLRLLACKCGGKFEIEV